MKTLRNLLYGVAVTVVTGCLFAVSSCTSDEPHNNVGENENREYVLSLNLSKSGFTDEGRTRSASGWEEGDKIYLLFSVDTLTTWGEALYKDGNWKLNYNGRIASDTLSRCQAVYFENAGAESGMIIKIGASTAIYEDREGSYFLKGDTLSISASLKPKTGRIRFSGNNHDEIKVYGISHHTSYDYFKGTYTSSIAPLSLTVDDKYTPYVYGEFSDKEEPRLSIYTPKYGFTRHFPKTIYGPAESGYMSIPTPDAHDGWQNHVNLKVNGVEFSMIPVEYSYGSFLLAETETTCELYKAITSLSIDASQYPVTNVTYNDCESFMKKISLLTSFKFRLPSESEWQFAYKGGNKSKGYTYSGSDDINDVAWYENNSGGNTHKVKELKPNELGFYDLSGNISEFYNNTTSYANGGNYLSDAYYCKYNSRVSLPSVGYSNDCGFRICFTY